MNKKLSDAAIRAWVQLHRAHRLLLAKVENTLKQHGLPPLAWYDVLLELDQVKDIGLRQYEISEKVLLHKHNLSRLIDRLEKKRLVKRIPSEDDARGNRVIITAVGIELLNKVWPIYSASIQENFGNKLSNKEFSDLRAMLHTIIESD